MATRIIGMSDLIYEKKVYNMVLTRALQTDFGLN